MRTTWPRSFVKTVSACGATTPPLAMLSSNSWSTRRIIDMVNESVMRAHLWAVDRCITRTYLQDVSESVASYLRSLETRGAILGSRVHIDPDANNETDISNGQVTIDFEITPDLPS